MQIEQNTRNAQRGELLGLGIEALTALALRYGAPPYQGLQLAQWLYRHRALSVDAMSNLSKRIRATLEADFSVGRVMPSQRLVSIDGTVKYLFEVAEGRSVESAVIAGQDRRTLCISNQSGCRMGCRFCATGKAGWGGNLTAGQIVNQLLSIREVDGITNVVFMGMGEPLDNYDNVVQALTIMTAPWGLSMSPRRITVSTIGLREPLRRLLSESECHVAVSLHSPFQQERVHLMPATSTYPIAGLMDDLRSVRWDGQRRLSFEYVVLRGINDTPGHTRALARLLRGLPCLVNLIGYHPHPLSPFARPEDATLVAMREALNAQGILCTVRASKGMDISAACGLLSRRHGSPVDS